MSDTLTRKSKLFLIMIVDTTIASLSFILTYWFLKDAIPDFPVFEFWWLLPTSSFLLILIFLVTGVYRAVVRYTGSSFFLKIMASSIIVSGLLWAIFSAFTYGGDTGGMARSLFGLYAIILSVGTAGSRLVARAVLDKKSSKNSTPAIIYGAGPAGYQLFSSLRYGGDFNTLAFVDDDPLQQGRAIHSLKVHSSEKLQYLIESKQIKTVLLAMPAISHEQRIAIIDKLHEFDVAIKTTPNLSDIISGKSKLSDLHSLSVSDLMARPSVQANEDLACFCVTDKSVLITGAGGSIGSELCRQILVRNPKKIILVEMTESALFHIQQELLERAAKLEESVEVVAVLGSILNIEQMKDVLTKHVVDSVFHAAAYKHVPMLEDNPIEGVRNNVLGTKRIAEAASTCGVGSLVVVSTDKAVRPTNLMGATKRFAELVVQSISTSNPNMSTCMVRFGNVLGSSGSVVPTFREQISGGGPVTVTDLEVTRFFMTIPEASQLVLQAGAMAEDTEIFVLDMGEPVKIYDLARRMIELSGYRVLDASNPEGDIEIVFTGLRPGEKMYEELSIADRLEETDHPKISKSMETNCELNIAVSLAQKLEIALQECNDSLAIQLVCQAVPEYTPSKKLLDGFRIEEQAETKNTTTCNL